jgi:hypothetical protein
MNIPFEPFPEPVLSDKEKEQRDCKDCLPEFNEEEVERLQMSSNDIRKKYPRFAGTCQTCGYRGIKYASYKQYIYGDY